MNQEEFDNKFITSTEVCSDLGVTRTYIFTNIRSKRFPEPLVIRRANGGTHIVLWLREEVQPIIEQCRLDIAAREAA